MAIDNAFTHFPILSTERFHLRQTRVEDAEALFAIRSNKEVVEGYGQKPYTSIEQAQALLQRQQTFYKQREAMAWAITFKENDIMIGSITLWNLDPDNLHVEIGYELNRVYWGQGVMTEVLPVILTYGFNELGLHRIEANVDESNMRSRKLILKIGFKYEGSARKRNFSHDHFEDEMHFGLLKDEW